MMKTAHNQEQKEDPISPPAQLKSTPDVNVRNIQDRIRPVAETAGPLSCLFYGRSGTGKTTLAGSFPAPVVLLDISEKGTDSVIDIPGMMVLKVENWEDFETMYWFLRAGHHPYQTVVVDTVTMLQKFAREYILEQNGKDKTGQMNRNLWGQVASLLTAWFINYRDLPMHTVFLAQDRNTTEEGNEGEDQIIQEIGPRLSPSVAAALTAAVKIIGQCYIKEFARVTPEGKQEKTYSFRLRIGPHSLYLTKVRKAKSIILPNSIHDPTYKKLITAISPKVTTQVEAPTETEKLADKPPSK